MKNTQDIILNAYYNIPGFYLKGFSKKVYNKILEKIFMRLANKFLPKYFEATRNYPSFALQTFQEKPSNDIIVSITSFPARINTTHLAIETILRQTLKPSRLILWLAESQFPNKDNQLSKELLQQKKRGLEIRYCEDLRSHKKYYFALKEFKDKIVIMMDDDLFFHKNVIKNLIEIHRKYPKAVVSSRVHKMKFEKNGTLLPYTKWFMKIKDDKPDVLNHHNSGHGTLIPPTIKLDDIFFNTDIIKEYSYNSDDVWFKVNLIRLGIPVVTNEMFCRDTLAIKGTYKSSLVSKNTHKGMKDEQFKATFGYFGVELTKNDITKFIGKN